jgi:ABC-type polysaccharide/polyol phosphate transport system ATPase subunit
MVSHHANIIDQFCNTALLLEKGHHVDTIAIRQNSNWRKQAASLL